MSEVTKALGRQIRMYRVQSMMTQEKLAELSDLHPTYIVSLEKGSKSATVDTLKKLADAFGVSLSTLMEFDSTSKTSEEYQIKALMHEYTTKLIAVTKKA